MPAKYEKIKVGKERNRNRKLPPDKHDEIRKKYAEGGTSQRKLAAEYGVSRRLITFILNPDKYALNRQRLAERQAEGRYYDKEKHRQYTKRYRDHKKEIYLKEMGNEVSS